MASRGALRDLAWCHTWPRVVSYMGLLSPHLARAAPPHYRGLDTYYILPTTPPSHSQPQAKANCIGAEGAATLAQSLPRMAALHHLLLDQNRIGGYWEANSEFVGTAHGVEALSRGLEGSRGLVRLGLSDNAIDADGARALRGAMVQVRMGCATWRGGAGADEVCRATRWTNRRSERGRLLLIIHCS